MTSALAKTSPPPAAHAMIVADALNQEAEQRKLLGQYVQQHMQEGTDYGVIPGTKNKTLLKPGAEKLTQLFRCIPRFRIEEKIEDWDTGLFFYRFTCQIVTQTDEPVVVAEGVGSCSTYESRYRWRQADRKCPACGKEAILRSKYPPKDAPEEPPGWYCFSKKGGCGANFDHDDDAITAQPTGRVQNPDLHDAANTVLKMAKKRSLVDAAIALARCSDLFTQDLDDLAGHDEAPAAKPEAKPEPTPARDPLRDELAAEMKRTGRGGKDGWAMCMQRLTFAFPTDAPYTPTTKYADIPRPRVEALVEWLRKQPDFVPPGETIPE